MKRMRKKATTAKAKPATKPDLQIDRLLPVGWLLQDFSYPDLAPADDARYVVVQAPRGVGHGGGGYVTIDFKDRTFSLGITKRHDHPRGHTATGRAKPSGAGWRRSLVREAIELLDNSLSGRRTPADKP